LVGDSSGGGSGEVGVGRATTVVVRAVGFGVLVVGYRIEDAEDVFSDFFIEAVKGDDVGVVGG
jgi:hypothetical protein